jgi:hypothetical protein
LVFSSASARDEPTHVRERPRSSPSEAGFKARPMRDFETVLMGYLQSGFGFLMRSTDPDRGEDEVIPRREKLGETGINGAPGESVGVENHA